MENYDINIYWAKVTIEVTIQQFNYIGHYRIQFKGNIKGIKALDIDTVFLENKDIIWNDCSLDIFENFEGEMCFKAVLKDKEGNFLLIDDYLTELEDLIVGIKIVNYEEEKQE